MEEIDIIELLKRVKQGKAPKQIEVGDNKYRYYREGCSIEFLYVDNDYDSLLHIEEVDFDTKIKILDKPFIEELEIKDEGGKYISPDTFEITAKVNEIVRYLRSKE